MNKGYTLVAPLSVSFTLDLLEKVDGAESEEILAYRFTLSLPAPLTCGL